MKKSNLEKLRVNQNQSIKSGHKLAVILFGLMAKKYLRIRARKQVEQWQMCFKNFILKIWLEVEFPEIKNPDPFI